jgi:autotransporter-associated beta strand protein
MNRTMHRSLSLAALLAGLCLYSLTAHAQNATWLATTTGGAWNTGSNWDIGVVPNSSTAIATFNAVSGQAYNVSIFKNESFTVGTLNLVGDVGGGPVLNTVFGTLKFDGAATINAETHPAAGSGINVNLVFLQNATINTTFADSLLNFSSPSVTGSPGVSLTKIGPGEVEFGSDSAISLTGALNVNDGTLTIFNALDVGASAGAKANVGTLKIANATVNVAGQLRITSGGVLALDTGFAINGPFVNGSFAPNGQITGDGGTIRTLAALTIPNNVALNAGGVILDSNGFDSTFSGTFTGSGGLTKISAGTVTLTADNSYSGDTTIQDGTLVVGTSSAGQTISTALGTGNVFLGGGTLRTTSATTGQPLQINVGGNYTQDAGGRWRSELGDYCLDSTITYGLGVIHSWTET